MAKSAKSCASFNLTRRQSVREIVYHGIRIAPVCGLVGTVWAWVDRHGPIKPGGRQAEAEPTATSARSLLPLVVWRRCGLSRRAQQALSVVIGFCTKGYRSHCPLAAAFLPRQIAVFSLTLPPRQPCASGGDDESVATARRKQCP
jgi:hypothetical protein